MNIRAAKHSQSYITIMYSVYIYPVSRQKLPSFLGIFRLYVYMDYACTAALICARVLEYVTRKQRSISK